MPSYTIEETISKWLKASSTITALVSTRVYPDTVPEQSLLPYVVTRVEEETEEQTFVTPSDNLRRITVAFGCTASRNATGYKTARDTIEALRTLLLNYAGTPVVGGRAILAVTEISSGGSTENDSGYDDQRVIRELRATLYYR